MSLAYVVGWCLVGFAGSVTIAILAYVLLQLVARRDVVARVAECELLIEELHSAVSKRQKRDAAQARRDVASSSPSLSQDDEVNGSTGGRSDAMDPKQRRNWILNQYRQSRGRG